MAYSERFVYVCIKTNRETFVTLYSVKYMQNREFISRLPHFRRPRGVLQLATTFTVVYVRTYVILKLFSLLSAF